MARFILESRMLPWQPRQDPSREFREADRPVWTGRAFPNGFGSDPTRGRPVKPAHDREVREQPQTAPGHAKPGHGNAAGRVSGERRRADFRLQIAVASVRIPPRPQPAG
jgi:hypothetical protein